MMMMDVEWGDYPAHTQAPSQRVSAYFGKKPKRKLCEIDHIDESIWEVFARCLHFNYKVSHSRRFSCLKDDDGWWHVVATVRIYFHSIRKTYSTLKMIIINVFEWMHEFGSQITYKVYTFRLLEQRTSSNMYFACVLFRLLVRLFFIIAFEPFIDLDLGASRMRQ